MKHSKPRKPSLKTMGAATAATNVDAMNNSQTCGNCGLHQALCSSCLASQSVCGGCGSKGYWKKMCRNTKGGKCAVDDHKSETWNHLHSKQRGHKKPPHKWHKKKPTLHEIFGSTPLSQVLTPEPSIQLTSYSGHRIPRLGSLKLDVRANARLNIRARSSKSLTGKDQQLLVFQHASC